MPLNASPDIIAIIIPLTVPANTAMSPNVMSTSSPPSVSRRVCLILNSLKSPSLAMTMYIPVAVINANSAEVMLCLHLLFASVNECSCQVVVLLETGVICHCVCPEFISPVTQYSKTMNVMLVVACEAILTQIYSLVLWPVWAVCIVQFFELYEVTALAAVFPLLAIFVYDAAHLRPSHGSLKPVIRR